MAGCSRARPRRSSVMSRAIFDAPITAGVMRIGETVNEIDTMLRPCGGIVSVIDGSYSRAPLLPLCRWSESASERAADRFAAVWAYVPPRGSTMNDAVRFLLTMASSVDSTTWPGAAWSVVKRPVGARSTSESGGRVRSVGLRSVPSFYRLLCGACSSGRAAAIRNAERSTLVGSTEPPCRSGGGSAPGRLLLAKRLTCTPTAATLKEKVPR